MGVVSWCGGWKATAKTAAFRIKNPGSYRPEICDLVEIWEPARTITNGATMLVGDTALAVTLRGYGCSTFRPKLREEFSAITEVVFAIKPLAVTT